MTHLQEKIAYFFQDHTLLERALTHCSASEINNERLEFLGDAVLGYMMAEHLFTHYPNAPEGELTRMRAVLVCGDCLARLAQKLEIKKYLIMGVSERKIGGGDRPAVLADAVEALIGAVYLDGGIVRCREVMLHLYKAEIDALPSQLARPKDAKSLLQEWLQGRKLPLPTYIARSSGLTHAQTFHVTCRVKGLPYRATGSGSNRRQAEQRAAQCFLDQVLAASEIPGAH